MPILTVAQGATIYAEDYNRMQGKVAAILGQGGGVSGADYGYGQAVISSQVVSSGPVAGSGDLVTAQQLNDLRTDIQKCWIHQTDNAFPLSEVKVTDVVASGSTTSAVSSTINKNYNDYIWAVNNIDTNRLSANPATMTLEVDAAFQSFSNWNNFRVNDVVVTFNDPNAKRYFFNAGGEFRISSSHVGSSVAGSKAYNWQQILANAGVIIVKYADITSLTSAPVILHHGYGMAGSVYAENYYKIIASAPSANQLMFKILFHDVDAGDQTGIGPAVDENVSGVTSSSVGVYYPSHSFTDSLINHTGVTLESPTLSSSQGNL
jgi:hypothetical protein